jgi:hypothetical protein
VITDRDNSPPGAVQCDSVELLLTYPNGSGGYSTKSGHPDAGGYIEFDSIPIGRHPIRLVYEPANDTVRREVSIDPGTHRYVDIRYYAEVWSDSGTPPDTGGIEYVDGTGVVPDGDCDELLFDITNTSSGAISISSLTLTWTSPVAYYKRIRWDDINVFNSSHPRSGSDDQSDFTAAQQIDPADTLQIRIEDFCTDVSGSCGSAVNMGDTEFTVELSDGTTFTFSTGPCNE